jgi:hypothetical protein
VDAVGFSALQRAEIAEIVQRKRSFGAFNVRHGFSALQRAEIAEMPVAITTTRRSNGCVSVLFNEPKLLKFAVVSRVAVCPTSRRFSALQRAEIAEMQAQPRATGQPPAQPFQCSSTSRNC